MPVLFYGKMNSYMRKFHVFSINSQKISFLSLTFSEMEVFLLMKQEDSHVLESEEN